MKTFSSKLTSGKAIGAQRDFARDFNRVLEILENIAGDGVNIEIEKSGVDWKIKKIETGGSSGGLPSGYEEKEVNVVTQTGIVRMTVLVKSDTEETTNIEDIETWDTGDYYKYLGIGTDGLIHNMIAVFKEGA